MLHMVMHMIVFTGVVYHEVWLVSGAPASDGSSLTFANFRPRFKIPRGNLSYYRRPHWEILYFMKFGIFPFYSNSSPLLNRTQFINKLRVIKDHFDRELNEPESMYNEADLQIERGANDIELHRPTSTEINLQHAATSKTFPGIAHASSDKREDSNRIESFRINKREALFRGGLRQLLADSLVSQFRRPPSHNFDNDNGGMHDPNELAAEMTIERKVGRKFQTQGWR